MQNLISTWQALDLRRRLIVGAATLGVFLAVIALARLSQAPRLGLLYAGLDPAVAGQVVAALEQRGVAYAIEGDSIRVDAARRDELRLTLAAEGLPATGAAGYELLDGLSGFGTTAQMFDAATWRAREGELARTILSMPGVRVARVHLAQAPAQPFQRDRRATASVTVTTAAGAVTEGQARALRHLVAAAVTGLSPADVAVIDSRGGLVALEEALPAQGGEARAEELKRAVERLLAARVGLGRAVVEVSVEVQTEREQLTERRIDPQGRVAISSESESRSSAGTEAGGQVTVASNLPEGDAAGGGGSSRSSETRERVNYEVSEMSREVVRAPGAVRRMTVAVLVDGITGADGAWTPRPEEELAALRDLVASAVGLDEGRGDVLTLRSLPFQPVAEAGALAEAGWLPTPGPVDVMALVQTGALLLAVLVLGLFVLRPLLAARIAPGLPEPEPLLALPAEPRRVLTGEIAGEESFALPEAEEPPEDPVERLRRLIDARRSESLEILRGWMEDGEERPAR